MPWSEIIKEILSVGVPLHNKGVDNWALTKEQALLAAEQLMNLKISILGGDVYELSDGEIIPTYDNWYTQRLINENKEEYLLRTISETRKYIANYKSASDKQIYFVLVPKFN
ncbi:MAG TPA: Imm40 family immunity protein [Vitreimonas sp.]|nr:Imm40 family immunity protein [Vitreimonas sp.]